MIKSQTKNKLKKLFVGFCALSMVTSMCIAAFSDRKNIKASIAGSTSAMLSGIGMGIAFDGLLNRSKEKD